MHGNLQKKEYQDINWSKPKTPEKYLVISFNINIMLFQDTKDATAEKAEKVKRNKKMVKENKILSSMFRTIDRETRIVSTNNN